MWKIKGNIFFVAQCTHATNNLLKYDVTYSDTKRCKTPYTTTLIDVLCTRITFTNCQRNAYDKTHNFFYNLLAFV